MSTAEADQLVRFIRTALQQGFAAAKHDLLETELADLQTRVFTRLEQELRRAAP
jgi:hypothetical protein